MSDIECFSSWHIIRLCSCKYYNMNNILNSTVFIVDDDPFTCLVYKKHLSNLGFNDVHHFLSGVDCLDNLYLNPDIILLDHQMSQITGFEILKKIKRFNPNISVIMVSGQEDMTTALDALRYGAFDYIIKDNTEISKIEKTLEKIAKLNLLTTKSTPSFFKKIFSIG